MATKATKQKALDALMICGTLKEAADVAGVSRRTLFNYLHADREFASQYRKNIEQASAERLDALEERYEDALTTVADIMSDSDEKPEVRLKAAQMILERIEEARCEVLTMARTNETSLSGPFSSFF